jgi:hypothetical protein
VKTALIAGGLVTFFVVFPVLLGRVFKRHLDPED